MQPDPSVRCSSRSSYDSASFSGSISLSVSKANLPQTHSVKHYQEGRLKGLKIIHNLFSQLFLVGVIEVTEHYIACKALMGNL